MIKRLSYLILAVCFLFGSISFASVKDTSVGTREAAPCPYGNGIHQMQPAGLAKVFDTDGNFKLYGGTYECDNCGHLFVCDGHPDADGKIGYYYYGGSLTLKQLAAGVYTFETDKEPYYTDSPYLEGYRFYPGYRTLEK